MSKKRATTVRIATSRIQIRGKETFPDYESTENHLSRRDSGAIRIYAKGPLLLGGGRDLYVYIETFGCQQNEADSERLCGMAVEMGYTPTTDPAEADLILINTCAVRDEFLQGWGKKNLPQ